MPAHSAHSFHCLAVGDHWFDDEQADHHHAPPRRRQPVEAALLAHEKGWLN
ncbi:hypothetical protein [Streptomyces sp. NPDC097981]|uniref:hypothetical protein n=1 Tax=Streptomyces sp. NPDC097981 TaxID=3155428 RepID=UPI00331D44F0